MQAVEDNPFLREVALWAVRNLCEGNLEIQKRIEELQVIEVAETPEMRAAGVSVEHDPATGKINFKQEQKG